MVNRKHECRRSDCTNLPHLGGLCKQHHEEDIEKREKRKVATAALTSQAIDGRLADNPELRTEMARLSKWWHRACDSIRAERMDEILQDEAEYAMEWCISLAQELVKAERAHRLGESMPSSLGYTRESVWSRFANLEAGLRSNGVKR